MNRGAAIVLALALLISSGDGEEQPGDWKEESKSKGVTIFSRVRAGSSAREFKAVGMIEAPARVVFAVLDDAEAYPQFMPYVSECRVLQRREDSVVLYQRLNLPLISDRDYTLRTRYEKSQGAGGTVYRLRWTSANEIGPGPIRGVLRVSQCEGGWLLEPQGSAATRATYVIYTDSGGALPPALADYGSRVAIRKLFDAIGKQVLKPKYSTAAASH